MLRRKSVLGFLAALLMVAGSAAGFAGAQNDADDEGASMEVQRRDDLTLAEMVEEADRIVAAGNQLSRRVSASLDSARREQDIIQVTCVNDKLTQVNANLRTAEQRAGNLRAAADSGDQSRANHEYVVLVVLGQKFDVLDRESSQCVGQDIFETGATRVETTIDPASPTENPSVAPGGDGFSSSGPFVPPPASPSI